MGQIRPATVDRVYNPPANRVSVDEAVWMIRSSGFGHLVSLGPHGLTASGLPFVAESEDETLVLRGHLARANAQWRTLDGADVLVIFPLTDGYVSPAWYPSKAENPRVVPTWNYEVVHVHGKVVVHNDATWTEQLVRDLTERHEAVRVGENSTAPVWSVDDAPATFLTKQLRAIVGIEIVAGHIEGKRKLSQNRSDVDQAGVVQGLERSDTTAARALAEAMRMSISDPDR